MSLLRVSDHREAMDPSRHDSGLRAQDPAGAALEGGEPQLRAQISLNGQALDLDPPDSGDHEPSNLEQPPDIDSLKSSDADSPQPIARLPSKPSSSLRPTMTPVQVLNGLDRDSSKESSSRRTSRRPSQVSQVAESLAKHLNQLSAFQADDIIKTSGAKHLRRCGSCSSKGPGANADESGDVVDVKMLMHSEAKRLTSRILSRAYSNDIHGMQAESQILEGCKQMRENTKTSWWFFGRKTQVAVLNPEHLEATSVVANCAVPKRQQQQNSDEGHTSYLGWISSLALLLTLLMAVIIALMAGGLILGSYHLGQWKLKILQQSISQDEGNYVYGYLWLLLYALSTCFVGSVLVTYCEPSSGGSGIPEVKAYLNGISVPRAFKVSTFLCRCIGMVLVTSAGMFAGPEGPFVQIGGIVGSWCADGPGCFGLKCWWPDVLKGHRNRCEFISQGAAIGVAAAFGAPIGGILFSLEEVTTYWSKHLLWRTFLGTLVASVLAKLTNNNFTSLNTSGFIEFPDQDAKFLLWELGPIAALGIMTGLFGALFCFIVKRLVLLRRSVFGLPKLTPAMRKARLLEVSLIVLATVSLCYCVPLAFGCQDLEAATGNSAGDERHLASIATTGPADISGIICPEGQYSTMAYILLQPKEAVTKALFSKDLAHGASMDIKSLLLSFVIIYFLTSITFGSALSVGLFIPNILSGACLGRAWGEALCYWGQDVHVGVFALMGASGALAGFSRMTVALAVIFMEITMNMYLLIPLIMVIYISKSVADWFGPGVVDVVLELNPEIHVLEDHLTEDRHIALESLTAHDACTSDVVVLRKHESAKKIISMLMQTSFSAYPVVMNDDRLVGLVLRSRIILMLSERAPEASEDEIISVLELAEAFPECAHWSTPVPSVFHRFRCSGLQHLLVIDEFHKLLGIMTRTDFAKLCRHGHEGVEEVKRLIHRKEAAVDAGLAVDGASESSSDSSSDGDSSSHDEADIS